MRIARDVFEAGDHVVRVAEEIGPNADVVDARRVALEARDGAARQDAARFRRAERWRDRLVDGGEEALVEFTAEYPAADGAELARLVAAAVAERRDDRSPGAGRKLFRFVQAALAAAT